MLKVRFLQAESEELNTLNQADQPATLCEWLYFSMWLYTKQESLKCNIAWKFFCTLFKLFKVDLHYFGWQFKTMRQDERYSNSVCNSSVLQRIFCRYVRYTPFRVMRCYCRNGYFSYILFGNFCHYTLWQCVKKTSWPQTTSYFAQSKVLTLSLFIGSLHTVTCTITRHSLIINKFLGRLLYKINLRFGVWGSAVC